MSDRGDSFLREVDEAVRQEHYKKLWDEYGIYALGLAVLVIAGVWIGALRSTEPA